MRGLGKLALISVLTPLPPTPPPPSPLSLGAVLPAVLQLKVREQPRPGGGVGWWFPALLSPDIYFTRCSLPNNTVHADLLGTFRLFSR